MTIGEKIKTLRKARGFSQAKLAEELGTHQATVYHWEVGICEPTIFNCIVIADYFGMTLDELCRGYQK